MKNKFKEWLDKLAAANKETYGNERLDCCAVTKTINNPNEQRNKAAKNQSK